MRLRPTRFRRATAVLTAALLIAGLTACAPAEDAADGRPTVVASTDVYGAIAKAVAGQHAQVRSLFTNPTGDPHEFEPSAQDTVAIKRATVAVYNGGHYDAYMEQALRGTSVDRVDATALQRPAGENEHVFYDLPAMKKVADAIADRLGDRDSAHRADYRRGADEFDVRLDAVIDRAREIGARHPGTDVIATEPVSAYLLTLSGLTDVVPPRYSAAIEAGSGPAPADIAAVNTLVADHRARIVLINAQTEGPVTANLALRAKEAGVPVVRVTESLPRGITDYVDWQSGNVDAISNALTPR